MERRLALTPRGRTGRALWSESVWRCPYLLGFRRKIELGPFTSSHLNSVIPTKVGIQVGCFIESTKLGPQPAPGRHA